MAMRDNAPASQLRTLVTSALGKEPVHWHRPHTGLSAAQRFVVRFADGSSAFVKAAVDDSTEGGYAPSARSSPASREASSPACWRGWKTASGPSSGSGTPA